MQERDPSRTGVVNAVTRVPGEEQLVIAKRLDDRGCRSCPAKRVEEETNRILDVLIRVERDAPGLVVHKPHGYGYLQLAASRFVHDPAAQPRAQHMQFGFTHG